MWTAQGEVDKAIDSLGMTADQIAKVPPHEAREVLGRIKARFLKFPGVRFWWEWFALPYETLLPPTDQGFELIPQITPEPAEKAWFIAGLTEDAKVVYECQPASLDRLLSECPFFEYAVVAKDLSWLVLENHHGCLFAVGDAAIENLRGWPD
jgi:hypothetical protein